MKLPDDVRQFRDISLLHDNALSPAQRAQLVPSISTDMLLLHQNFVRKLLGCSYCMVKPTQNRSKTSLARWLGL